MAMSLGRLHEFHSADSILPVPVSLQRWDSILLQDRFGMLVPLRCRCQCATRCSISWYRAFLY